MFQDFVHEHISYIYNSGGKYNLIIIVYILSQPKWFRYEIPKHLV